MRFRFALIGVAAVCGALSAAAFADPRTSKREDVREAASRFADCAVRFNAPVARGVVLQNFTNHEIIENRDARRLIEGTCVGNLQSDHAIGPPPTEAIRFGGDMFRYNIAEALVRSDYPTIRHFDFSSIAPLTHHALPSALPPTGTTADARKAQKEYANAVTASTMSRFGECVARRNPDSVHQLLLTRVNTADENSAFSQIAPLMGECLSDGQIRLGRGAARGLLALGFYRLAGAPADAEVKNLKGRPNA